ncbi:MAG: 16S rRNA (cytidine(1402)-2'-O)-methyltransferase [Peptoniphilaceae bacterium]|nr:16S rRNA (cytidine(1402)-2'-O)-methyltransferase [Peptoniphilaceae bacterium]MDD7383403.1 16S rRNA (cytidine(1402)-2'-O)-methyltransferase [Peptoniphilaceae bacterium]MDY3738798.1 16S rRNA (cytidine(1402)-2'-O)-methyltransferase [Peptoniphilaceae bacterium]
MNDYKIYFVPTPIGNLYDITLRAIDVLKESDIIACEDTRESYKLLNHYSINKKLISYHKFNESTRSDELIQMAIAGKKISVITDQGMPGISDPGHVLIEKCIDKKIPYTVLPGASSILTALVASGFDNSEFSYYGFIPKKNKDKKIYYKKLENETKTSILLDTPHNIENTIKDFKVLFPERKLAIARELTKIYENILIKKISEILIDDIILKGEMVLILEGGKIKKNEIKDIEDEIKYLIKSGKKTKEISKYLSKKTGISTNEIYNYIINNKL